MRIFIFCDANLKNYAVFAAKIILIGCTIYNLKSVDLKADYEFFNYFLLSKYVDSLRIAIF